MMVMTSNTEQTQAALLTLRGEILNKLLSGQIDRNETDFDLEFPLIEEYGHFDPLVGFRKAYHYDPSKTSIDEIRNYLADFGLTVIGDDFPKVVFDFDFMTNYQPQTKLVTTKFLWRTRHELVGIHAKDRIKLALDGLYPSFSDNALINYIERDGYKSNGKRMLLVKPCDIRFQAVRRFAIKHDAKISANTLPGVPDDRDYVSIRFEYGWH